MAQENYNGIALTFAIIALFGMILIGGFVYLNNQPTDLSGIEAKLDQQANAISSNSNAIADLNSATKLSLTNLEARILQTNTNSYFDFDYEDEIEDLEDAIDCLEDFANGGSKTDLDNCLEDI